MGSLGGHLGDAKSDFLGFWKRTRKKDGFWGARRQRRTGRGGGGFPSENPGADFPGEILPRQRQAFGLARRIYRLRLCRRPLWLLKTAGLETVGSILEALGDVLGAVGHTLETLGDILEILGDLLRRFGDSWGPPGDHLETLGDLLGDSWAPTGHPWRLAEPSWRAAGRTIVPLEAFGWCQMVSR